MAIYPSTLPSLDIVGGTALALGNGTIRTAMEFGPDKTRRRTTSEPRVYTLQHPEYDDTQLTDLIDFYENTTRSGALSFTMADPLTAQTATFKFLDAPTFEAAGGNSWAVSCQMERFA